MHVVPTNQPKQKPVLMVYVFLTCVRIVQEIRHLFDATKKYCHKYWNARDRTTLTLLKKMWRKMLILMYYFSKIVSFDALSMALVLIAPKRHCIWPARKCLPLIVMWVLPDLGPCFGYISIIRAAFVNWNGMPTIKSFLKSCNQVYLFQ